MQITDPFEGKIESEGSGYFWGSERLQAVTNLLYSWVPEFDREGISLKVARKRGVTQQSILDEWEANGRESRERGSFVHQYIARVLRGDQLEADPLGLAGEDRKYVEQRAFDEFWRESQAQMTPVFVEWLIGDLVLGLAGKVDALLLSEKTGKVHPFDWKTGKMDVTNDFGDKLLPPFEMYDNCSFITGSLQLSIYWLILEAALPVPVGAPYLVSLSVDGWTAFPARDFRAELRQWFMGRNDNS